MVLVNSFKYFKFQNLFLGLFPLFAHSTSIVNYSKALQGRKDMSRLPTPTIYKKCNLLFTFLINIQLPKPFKCSKQFQDRNSFQQITKGNSSHKVPGISRLYKILFYTQKWRIPYKKRKKSIPPLNYYRNL